ncbi:MAG TPA: GtrA family protein [Ktedonobacterales bacterium]
MAKRMPQKSAADYYDTQPVTAATPKPNQQLAEQDAVGLANTQQRKIPSYHPTGIALVDRSLDIADRLTSGRAEWIQRLFSYLFVGGIAAIINLITLKFTLDWLATTSVPYGFQYNIAFLIATEISIMANFIPNDRITFSRLPGHSRSWLHRCARFHVTCIGGVIVTYAIFSLLHVVFKIHPLPSQAVALIIATAFNFTFHHVFTYRHKPATVL